MPGKQPRPIILLATDDQSAAVLAYALAANPEIDSIDDGGLLARAGELIAAAIQTGGETIDAHGSMDGGAHLIDELPPSTREKALLELRTGLEQAGTDLSVERLGAAVGTTVRSALAPSNTQHACILARGAATVAVYIGRLLPDASLVHLIRDGRALALGPAADSHRSPVRSAHSWREQVIALARMKTDAPNRVIEVLWEDVLEDPPSTLGQLTTALGLSSMPDAAARLQDALSDATRYQFRPQDFDPWPVLEVESSLAPWLGLLGYIPQADIELASSVRGKATALDSARAEANALRAQLEALRQTMPATEEVQQLHDDGSFGQEPFNLRTLQWKAKRYDQIRAAASPLLRLKRRRAQRKARRRGTG